MTIQRTTSCTKFSFEHTPNAAVRIHRISNRRSLINAPRTLCTRGRIYELIKKKGKMGTAKKGVFRERKRERPLSHRCSTCYTAHFTTLFSNDLWTTPLPHFVIPLTQRGEKGKGRARHPCSSVMTVIAGKRQPPGTKAKGRPHRWDYRRFGVAFLATFRSLAIKVYITFRVFFLNELFVTYSKELLLCIFDDCRNTENSPDFSV